MNQIKEINIDIPITHDPYSNCVQDIFITYLKWKKLDYRNLFDHSWCFHFNENNGFDVDVYRDPFTQLFESLEQNFGLHLNFLENNWEKTIQQELQKGNIVGACLDTFYCTWHKSYKKYHNQHFVLINGMEQNGFYCIDPYGSLCVEFIRFIQIKSIVKQIFLIEEVKNEKINWTKNVIKQINLMKEGVNGIGDFDQIRNFSYALVNRKNCFIDEVKLFDQVAFYPLLLRLNNIGFGRKNFADYLRVNIKETNSVQLSVICESLDDLAVDWGRVSSLFIKYILFDYKETVQKRIVEYLQQIALKEEETAEKLLKILKTM